MVDGFGVGSCSRRGRDDAKAGKTGVAEKVYQSGNGGNRPLSFGMDFLFAGNGKGQRGDVGISAGRSSDGSVPGYGEKKTLFCLDEGGRLYLPGIFAVGCRDAKWTPVPGTGVGRILSPGC